jgi:hypothetical protein
VGPLSAVGATVEEVPSWSDAYWRLPVVAVLKSCSVAVPSAIYAVRVVSSVPALFDAPNCMAPVVALAGLRRPP